MHSSLITGNIGSKNSKMFLLLKNGELFVSAGTSSGLVFSPWAVDGAVSRRTSANNIANKEVTQWEMTACCDWEKTRPKAI